MIISEARVVFKRGLEVFYNAIIHRTIKHPRPPHPPTYVHYYTDNLSADVKKKKEKKTGYYLGKNYLGIKVLGTKKQDGDLGTDEAVRV